MTVGELRALLAPYADDMELVIEDKDLGEFQLNGQIEVTQGSKWLANTPLITLTTVDNTSGYDPYVDLRQQGE